MIIEIVSTALVTSLAWLPVVRSKAHALTIERDRRIATEYARDTAQALLSSEKFENEHLASDIAFLGKQRDRLQNKYDAANVLIDKLHDELADIKSRALFRNAKGQMYSLNPAKKAPKPVEVAPADRVMAA